MGDFMKRFYRFVSGIFEMPAFRNVEKFPGIIATAAADNAFDSLKRNPYPTLFFIFLILTSLLQGGVWAQEANKKQTHSNPIPLSAEDEQTEPFASPSENNHGEHISIEKGQLVGSPIEVFYSGHDVSIPHPPSLVLFDIWSTKENVTFRGMDIAQENGSAHGRYVLRDPIVIPNQLWNHDEGKKGHLIGELGTLLIYDTSYNDFPGTFRTGFTLFPILCWENGKGSCDKRVTKVNEKPLYLGKSLGAYIYTGFVFLGIFGLLLLIHFLGKKSIVYIFCSPNGRASLNRFQLILWTVAVSALTFKYGMTQLRLPEIPQSLLVLMGLSVATSAFFGATDSGEKMDRENIVEIFKPDISQFITEVVTIKGERRDVVSITKVQMLIWTILIVTVFVLKSVNQGILWEVPWELVVLMGVSQAGYVLPGQINKLQSREPDTGSNKEVPPAPIPTADTGSEKPETVV